MIVYPTECVRRVLPMMMLIMVTVVAVVYPIVADDVCNTCTTCDTKVMQWTRIPQVDSQAS